MQMHTHTSGDAINHHFSVNQIKSFYYWFQIKSNQISYFLTPYQIRTFLQIKWNQIKPKRMNPTKYQYKTFFNTLWHSNGKVVLPPRQNRFQIWILLADLWSLDSSHKSSWPMSKVMSYREKVWICSYSHDLKWFGFFSNQMTDIFKSSQNFWMPPNQIKLNRMVWKLVIQSQFNQINIWFGWITDTHTYNHITSLIVVWIKKFKILHRIICRYL